MGRPCPSWSSGPLASYLATPGRIIYRSRLFCLIERRGRGVRGSLEGPDSSWVELGSVMSFPTRLRTRVECTRTLTRWRLTVPRPGRLAECRNDQERLPDDAAPSRGRRRIESHLFPYTIRCSILLDKNNLQTSSADDLVGAQRLSAQTKCPEGLPQSF